MIVIAFLFIRMLCDCFKSPRGSRNPGSAASAQCPAAAHATSIAFALGRPRSVHLALSPLPRILDATTIVSRGASPASTRYGNATGRAAFRATVGTGAGGRGSIGKLVPAVWSADRHASDLHDLPTPRSSKYRSRSACLHPLSRHRAAAKRLQGCPFATSGASYVARYRDRGNGRQANYDPSG